MHARFLTSWSATSLNPSESSSYDNDCDSGTAALRSFARSSLPADTVGFNSLLMPIPNYTDANRRDIAAKTAKPLNKCHFDVRARHASAAARPAGPDPTTRQWWMTSISRAGSVTFLVVILFLEAICELIVCNNTSQSGGFPMTTYCGSSAPGTHCPSMLAPRLKTQPCPFSGAHDSMRRVSFGACPWLRPW